jgi:hypothetical protein
MDNKFAVVDKKENRLAVVESKTVLALQQHTALDQIACYPFYAFYILLPSRKKNSNFEKKNSFTKI